MDKHDNARHLGECCGESLACGRTSASSVNGLMMVMTVHLYVPVVCFTTCEIVLKISLTLQLKSL